MLAIHEPIGRFVALVNLEKNILSQRPIEQEVINLVDLIKVRIKDKPIEEVANSLLENVFYLRFDIFEWLVDNDKDISFYRESLGKHISVNLQLAPFSDLAAVISSVLLAYENIVSPIFENLPDSFEQIIRNIQKNRPEYDTFKLLSFHPSPQIKFLKNWIDSSLQLEVGLILAQLILTSQVQLSKKRIKSELIEFLLSAITKFGAYSIFTGFWTPDSNDTSNLTNKMKIFSATLELDNNIYYRTSKEGFFKIVNN